MTEPIRSCGECRACCVAPSIDDPELFKPKWKPCVHLATRAECPCSIYEKRPAVCRQFVCAWLAGELPEELRPDRCVMFLTIRPDGERLVVSLTEADKNAWEEDEAIIVAVFDRIRTLRLEGDDRPVVFEINMHPFSRRRHAMRDFIVRWNKEARS